MSVGTDIDAINARTDLSDQQKRRMINALKSGQIEQVLLAMPGHTYTVGAGATRISVVVNYTWTNPETGNLHMDLSITRGTNPAVPLVFSNPVVITNYPPIWDDAADLIALGRKLLTDFAANF